jgi:hypothetical protein
MVRDDQLFLMSNARPDEEFVFTDADHIASTDGDCLSCRSLWCWIRGHTVTTLEKCKQWSNLKRSVEMAWSPPSLATATPDPSLMRVHHLPFL